jgi:hypothetical protein
MKVWLLAPSTWRSYTPTWTRLWRWCRPHLRVLGAPSVRGLHVHERVLFNYLTFLHGLASSKKTTVTLALKVANFAFKLHGLGSKACKPEQRVCTT